ncbi:hypothetical protein Tco_0769282 [Tanacetum coccineum]|uniref:Uncharacterized protein n=1 Tax=Tanacetum coccineum TaxID=301880 RepID=A0ABQ4ZA80_9ASTR
MQQFWYTIKKVQGTDSYEFLLANKKCIVNADVFRTILDICPRVKGIDFTDVPDDDIALTFLIDLGYKGPLYKHTNMFVDHMHQPWRTLAAIINKCLSENVDYPELIWEDLAYQIDHRKEKKSRRKNMPYPRVTKIIINHFLKQHKSLSNLNYQHYHTIKDDGIVSRLKFVRIGKDYQEYRLPIPETMLTQAIKQYESYQMFIKYLTSRIPPKKSRGKCSKGKKTVDDSQETVDVSEESKPKPKPVKKKTASRRVVKKKVTLSADDNIISNDHVAALELGKSISKIEAEEAEDARQAHATHARIVTETIPEPARKRSSEQEVVDTMKALKESKKSSRRQPSTRGSNEGTGAIPGVLDESTVVSATSSEGGDKQDSEYEDDDNDDVEKDDKDGDADDEGNDHISDTQDVDDEDEKKEKEELTDATKPDAEKSAEEVGDAEKAAGSSSQDATKEDISSLMDITIQQETPQIQSPLVLKVHVTVILEITNLPPIPEILTDTPVSTAFSSPQVTPIILTVQQTTTPIPTPPITTDAPTITTVVHESDTLSVIQLRVAKLEKDVSEIKKIDLSAEALAALKIHVPSVLDNYLGSKVEDVFQKELKKHMAYLIQKYSLQQNPQVPKKQTPTVDLEQESEKSPFEILKIKKEQAEMRKMQKFTIKSTDKAALEEYDLKSTLYRTMHANKLFNKNPANYKLYHALMEALIENESDIDKGVADTIKDHKRKHDNNEYDDDEDPPAGPNRGKAPSKGSKTGKSASAKEPVEEPIAEVVIDDAGDDVVRDDDQPQDDSQPKKDKTPEWFKPPLRPLTPDPKWNKRQDPLTFNDLMATAIDFSKSHSHLTVAADYFFNNDLEYLKSSDPERTYTTSITKTKAARYEIEGIEDMVLTLWSPTKVGSQLNKFSKHNVYSTKKIMGVKSVSVQKLHGYGYLEEIVVKRTDHKFYKFKEGDFVDLHLNDIEDMLLLTVQHKLFHLIDSDIVDFIVALHMFTRSLVIKKCVEDLQLGVESYQKKLSLTPPQHTIPEIKFKEPYTPSHNPPGVIYEDLTEQKKVMRADDLYKFSDRTLKKVQDELHHTICNFHLEYNKEMPIRKWKAIDRKRSKLMFELTDKQMRERRVIRNLKRLVGARELEMDYKMMTRTICSLDPISKSYLSDTKVFTMMMEILPKPTSNKLCGR